MPGVGTNRYAYSRQDPINKSDPNGRSDAGYWGVGPIGQVDTGSREFDAVVHSGDPTS